jgi:hypothetical protein
LLENSDSKLLKKLIEKLRMNKETEINSVIMKEKEKDDLKK